MNPTKDGARYHGEEEPRLRQDQPEYEKSKGCRSEPKQNHDVPWSISQGVRPGIGL